MDEGSADAINRPVALSPCCATDLRDALRRSHARGVSRPRRQRELDLLDLRRELPSGPRRRACAGARRSAPRRRRRRRARPSAARGRASAPSASACACVSASASAKRSLISARRASASSPTLSTSIMNERANAGSAARISRNASAPARRRARQPSASAPAASTCVEQDLRADLPRREEAGALVGEVLVEGLARDAGARDHLRDGRRGVALLGDALRHRLQQPAALRGEHDLARGGVAAAGKGSGDRRATLASPCREHHGTVENSMFLRSRASAR